MTASLLCHVCLSAAAALRVRSVLEPCGLRLATLLPARATRRAYVDAPVHAPVVKVLPLVRKVSIALRSSQTHTPAGFRCALLLARRPGQLQIEAATGRRPPLVGQKHTHLSGLWATPEQVPDAATEHHHGQPTAQQPALPVSLPASRASSGTLTALMAGGCCCWPGWSLPASACPITSLTPRYRLR